jgi:hypothetical protein
VRQSDFREGQDLYSFGIRRDRMPFPVRVEEGKPAWVTKLPQGARREGRDLSHAGVALAAPAIRVIPRFPELSPG